MLHYKKCDTEKNSNNLARPFNELPWFDLYFFAAKNKKVEQCLMVGIGLDLSLFKNASKCELFIWHNAKLGEIISMHSDAEACLRNISYFLGYLMFSRRFKINKSRKNLVLKVGV